PLSLHDALPISPAVPGHAQVIRAAGHGHGLAHAQIHDIRTLHALYGHAQVDAFVRKVVDDAVSEIRLVIAEDGAVVRGDLPVAAHIPHDGLTGTVRGEMRMFVDLVHAVVHTVENVTEEVADGQAYFGDMRSAAGA